MDGSMVREMRKRSHKTLRQISIESNVTENQILNIETGKTANPGIVTLAALAAAMDCSVSDFMGRAATR
ncbi:helix-turn-helix domain-containing protein [Olsenella phocaeensis]|uniref:helix-turn-helix domain-containing protein n=1 Tax=Olsenella phocaeensis TaxID=1852385 RepID=UPI0009309BA2|nr:helix-turn-helix transcriptional regulator [Olsenella phocaeensis]